MWVECSSEEVSLKAAYISREMTTTVRGSPKERVARLHPIVSEQYHFRTANHRVLVGETKHAHVWSVHVELLRDTTGKEMRFFFVPRDPSIKQEEDAILTPMVALNPGVAKFLQERPFPPDLLAIFGHVTRLLSQAI